MRPTPRSAQVQRPPLLLQALRAAGAGGVSHGPSRTADHEPRGIGVYLIPPSPLDLYINTAPKLTCLVVDLESKEGVKVSWSRESGKSVSPDPWKCTEHFNATVSITATLPVVAKDWIDGETYRCTVSRSDLPKDIVRSIAKAPGEVQAGAGGWPSLRPERKGLG